MRREGGEAGRLLNSPLLLWLLLIHELMSHLLVVVLSKPLQIK